MDSKSPKPLFDDEPPAYEYSQKTRKFYTSRDKPLPELNVASTSTSSNPYLITNSTPISSTLSKVSRRLGIGATARTDKDVKATVLTLVRDVVKEPSSPSSVAILQSCSEACRARNISFEALLQEKSIAEHTPLYWSIMTRDSSGPPSNKNVEILDILLSFPLSESTYNDACTACIRRSDNSLYQWIYRSKPLQQTGAERMLFQDLPNDIVEVEHHFHNSAADTGAFKVFMRIQSFRKRMSASKKISLRFVARERLWAIVFSQDPLPGMDYNRKKSNSGYICLYLMPDSPSSPLTGRITIPPAVTSQSTRAAQAISIGLSIRREQNVRLQSGASTNGLGVSLDHVAGGSSLQHEGCSYFNRDGSMDLTLEATLTDTTRRPECIIM